MAKRTALDSFCEITTSDGTRYKWDANQPPSSRLRGLTFSTKIGEGFSLATGNLARRIDLDYPDLQLGMEIVITGADGHVLFEGRLVAMPREVGQEHSISVTFVGHMAHAKDRKFTEDYVNRDHGAWGAMSLARRSGWLLANFSPTDATQIADPTDNKAAVSTMFSDPWASPYKKVSEAWYDAGPGVTIGKVGYSWQSTLGAGDANWIWQVVVASDDKATATESTGDLQAAGPSTLQTFDPTAEYRYAYLQLYYNATPGGSDGEMYAVDWYKLAVYGTHGLTLHTGEPGEPAGVYVSDVVRDIASRWCPELDTSGIQEFPYVIQHCVFKEDTYPHDAWLELNKFALQHLAVWEGKRLDFRPYDLSDYDWEIRTDDQGTIFSPVGLTADDLFNGIVMIYDDILTGTRMRVTPDDNDDLRDTSTANPWNQWGRDHWDYLTLSKPVHAEEALQIGRAALAEKNRPKTPGTLTVRGYIRDRAGIQQPASKPRAGDVICISNFNEINRLIVETDWDDEQKEMRIAVDFPFQLLEALFDRQANAQQARGLA